MTLGPWVDLGDTLRFDFAFRLNKLACGMMLVVAMIGALVHVFSLGYMKDDAGKPRYYAGLVALHVLDERDRPRGRTSR